LPEISKWFTTDVREDDVENCDVETPTYLPAVLPSLAATNSNEEASTSSQQGDSALQDFSSGFQERLEKLQQIFVGKDAEELRRAALRHTNLDDAINDILDAALESHHDLSGKDSMKCTINIQTNLFDKLQVILLMEALELNGLT
jgi:hypothetical protein